MATGSPNQVPAPLAPRCGEAEESGEFLDEVRVGPWRCRGEPSGEVLGGLVGVLGQDHPIFGRRPGLGWWVRGFTPTTAPEPGELQDQNGCNASLDPQVLTIAPPARPLGQIGFHRTTNQTLQAAIRSDRRRATILAVCLTDARTLQRHWPMLVDGTAVAT